MARLAEGSHAELVAPLRDGELDVIVGALRQSSVGDDLVQRELFVDRPVEKLEVVRDRLRQQAAEIAVRQRFAPLRDDIIAREVAQLLSRSRG